MGTAIAGYTTSSDALLRFRTGYIRAIAEAWENEEFMEELLVQRDVLSWKPFVNLLPNGKDLPWTAKVQIRRRDDGPLWTPGITAGWLGSDDCFEIMLPETPDDHNDFENALGQYNQMFPTLLGHKYSILDTEGQKLSKEEAGADPSIDGAAIEFVNFSNVLLQAIALSWASDSHEKSGKKGSDELIDFRSKLAEDGVSVLSKYFGFNNPWNFEFRFILPENLDDPKKYRWNCETKRWGELYNTIKLNYPHKPKQGENDPYIASTVRTVALANYNASGLHYPFSCP